MKIFIILLGICLTQTGCAAVVATSLVSGYIAGKVAKNSTTKKETYPSAPARKVGSK